MNGQAMYADVARNGGGQDFASHAQLVKRIAFHLHSRLPLGAIKEKERPAHPVIFSRVLYPELLTLRGDVGARALFTKYTDQVCLIEPEGPYDGRDIDTPEDYAGFQISLKNQGDEQNNE